MREWRLFLANLLRMVCVKIVLFVLFMKFEHIWERVWWWVFLFLTTELLSHLHSDSLRIRGWLIHFLKSVFSSYDFHIRRMEERKQSTIVEILLFVCLNFFAAIIAPFWLSLSFFLRHIIVINNKRWLCFVCLYDHFISYKWRFIYVNY